MLVAATLAFAVWGCGSDNPNYPTTDGGGQRDADRDAEPTPDGARQDARRDAGDGGDPDAQEDEGPIITITAPAGDKHVRDGSIVLQFTASDPYDGLKGEAPSVTLDGQTLTVSGLTTPAAGDLTYAGSGTFTVTSPCQAGGFAEGTHTLAVGMRDVGDRLGVGTVTVVVDCSGPTLTPVTPLEAVIVGGATEFRLQVQDLAGIDDSSVRVEITERPPNPAVVLTLLRPPGLDPTSGEFAIYYQTDNLPQPMIRPQLLWRARDILGNETLVAYEIALDNAAPRVSLTSPKIYPARLTDCWAVCGDGTCEAGEDALQCPVDCGECGDTNCSLGETTANCPQDCQGTCGDGVCVGETESPDSCASDCQRSNVGDGVCSLNESCASTPGDCGQCRTCRAQGDVLECARREDPLANWMWVWDTNVVPNAWVQVHLIDGARIPQMNFVRARVQDRGNYATGVAVVPVSLTNQAKVRLLVLPRDDRALVMASAGVCDHLNPALKETTALTGTDPDEVLTVDMVPVTPSPTGTGDYRPFSEASPPPVCGSLGDPNVTDQPQPLCARLARESQANYVMPHPGIVGEPAIYTLAPVTVEGPYCQGTQFDAGYLPDGWICVAVEAEDNVGNRAISKPLHVCVDKDWANLSVCGQSRPNTCAADAVTGGTVQCDIDDPYESDTGNDLVILPEL
jgi:hypothetical protein